MDIGVGAFIVSSAIASSYARQARPRDPIRYAQVWTLALRSQSLTDMSSMAQLVCWRKPFDSTGEQPCNVVREQVLRVLSPDRPRPRVRHRALLDRQGRELPGVRAWLKADGLRRDANALSLLQCGSGACVRVWSALELLLHASGRLLGVLVAPAARKLGGRALLRCGYHPWCVRLVFLHLYRGRIPTRRVRAATSGYQMYLSHYGGEEFVINAPRDTLFRQNREGIFSLAGIAAR
jgi:hypothetical protein